jgi:hypothetical protein
VCKPAYHWKIVGEDRTFTCTGALSQSKNHIK